MKTTRPPSTGCRADVPFYGFIGSAEDMRPHMVMGPFAVRLFGFDDGL